MAPMELTTRISESDRPELELKLYVAQLRQTLDAELFIADRLEGLAGESIEARDRVLRLLDEPDGRVYAGKDIRREIGGLDQCARTMEDRFLTIRSTLLDGGPLEVLRLFTLPPRRPTRARASVYLSNLIDRDVTNSKIKHKLREVRNELRRIELLAYADPRDLLFTLTRSRLSVNIELIEDAGAKWNERWENLLGDQRIEDLERTDEILQSRRDYEASAEELQVRALGEIARLRVEIAERESELDQFVHVARDAGASWGRIGAILQITRQAAMRKYDSSARARAASYRRRQSGDAGESSEATGSAG